LQIPNTKSGNSNLFEAKSWMNFNDNDILTGITSGNRAVFDLVFRRYYSGLCTFANDFIHSYDIAEEITQDMFVYLWENHNKIQIKNSLKAYLYRSIHNRCLNYLRDNDFSHKKVIIDTIKGRADLIFTEIPESVFDLAFSDNIEQELERTIENLPAQCKAIFCLNRFENLSYQEIAERLDISTSTVRTQISRALSKIRDKMGKFL
jgi:RNA polymerase sigma-70 factor (family 1)